MTYLRRRAWFATLAAGVLTATAGCDGVASSPQVGSAGIVVEQSDLVPLQAQTTKAVMSAPPSTMNRGGLVGVLGGARVKFLAAGTHEVLLPLPQLSESQIPVCYAITSTPRGAAKGYRIGQRDGSNAIVSVQLQGPAAQEVQLNWSSIILIADRPLSPEGAVSQLYRQETACVQSGAPQVRTLAEKLWPPVGSVDAYAANIQEFIRGRNQTEPLRSLDALGILQSGNNGICTANANLAVALLRAKGVSARSVAVVPPTGQRLEMHRIVEYAEGRQWRSFDPSSLHRDIPLKPWQNVVMAWTTPADENVAMKLRRGAMQGCPYGQELEIVDDGLTLCGQDFFWTLGKPLAEFEASEEALKVARAEWQIFLETGKLSKGQIRAASASRSDGFLDALRTNGREPDGAADGSHAIRSETNATSSPAGFRR